MDGSHAQWVILVGAIAVTAALVCSASARLGISGAVGLIAAGLLLRFVDTEFALLLPAARDALSFLADLGLVALLFRVGLESDLKGLLETLPHAAIVWIGDVGVSSTLGFVAARYGLGFELLPSLVVAIALSATSIGVSVAVWESAKRLQSSEGRLLLDVAELDDISGVFLLALLIGVMPFFLAGEQVLGGSLLATMAVLAAKLLAFGALCVFFSQKVEPHIARFLCVLNPAPAPMLVVAGLGLMIAGLAGLLGFSLAIGALFAGLVFSRDPAAVKTEGRFDDLHAFFVPFFFIGIGFSVDPAVFDAGLLAATLVVLAAAIAGKLLGGGLPALAFTGFTGALAIGVSLVPRAEIALYVAHEAQARGPAVLPAAGYATVVMVALATSLLAPLAARPLVSRAFSDGGARQ